MKLLFLSIFAFVFVGVQAQEIIADKTTPGGGRFLVVSNTSFGEVKEDYSNSLQFVCLRASAEEEMYIINMQMKRDKDLSLSEGRVVLFKLTDGKVIESKISDVEDTSADNKLQRALGHYNVHITGFNTILNPNQVKSLIEGKVTKIRIETADINEDIEVTNNSFSELLKKDKDLIDEKLKEIRSVYDNF